MQTVIDMAKEKKKDCIIYDNQHGTETAKFWSAYLQGAVDQLNEIYKSNLIAKEKKSK